MFNLDLVRFRPLRAGAAAGHYTLPADVLSHFETLDRLEQFQTERPDRAAPAARVELAAEIVAAAQAGKPLPSGANYGKAEQADHAADVRSKVLAEVLEDQGSALVTRFSVSALTIVVEHLRPALAEVVDAARGPAEAVAPFGTDAENYLRAPEDVRGALLDLRAMAERYAAIRSARSVFRPDLKVEYDSDGSFGEFRSLHIVAPSYRQPNAPLPWPTDRVARLAWAVTSGVEPWMPTPDEQDARWMEVYGERMNQRTALAAAARGFGARTAALSPQPPQAA